jgi:hypothetical protein
MKPPNTVRRSTAWREAIPPRQTGGETIRWVNASPDPGHDCLPIGDGRVKMPVTNHLGGESPAGPTSLLIDAAERIPGLPGAAPFAYASTRPLPWRS